MAAKEKFPISHVLVDCENVGLSGLLDLVVATDGTPIKFVLFHNATNKMSLPLDRLKDLSNALSDGRLEDIGLSIPENMTKKQAENALDFYIAFYMGQVMPFAPFNSHCVILSKDHDYDPLILHVQKEFGKERCERIESYEALAKRLGIEKVKAPAKASVKAPTPKAQAPKQPAFDVNKFVEKAKKRLKVVSKNPPSTMAKLQNTLKNWFKADKLTEANLQKLIEALQTAKVLTVDAIGKKVKY